VRNAACDGDDGTFGSTLYSEAASELSERRDARLARLRNPTAVAELRDGETVPRPRLGGGIDVLLSARARSARAARRSGST
jgi:hypothetical protein